MTANDTQVLHEEAVSNADSAESNVIDPTEMGNVLKYEKGLLVCDISPVFGRSVLTSYIELWMVKYMHIA